MKYIAYSIGLLLQYQAQSLRSLLSRCGVRCEAPGLSNSIPSLVVRLAPPLPLTASEGSPPPSSTTETPSTYASTDILPRIKPSKRPLPRPLPWTMEVMATVTTIMILAIGGIEDNSDSDGCSYPVGR